MKKVLWILNNVPNYRNILVEELAKCTELTVVSFNGEKRYGLKNPKERNGYNYKELKDFEIGGIFLNPKEFIINKNKFDVIIIGFDIKHPFRLLNVLFNRKKVIFSGIIFGKSKSKFMDIIRSFWLNRVNFVLVYSDWVSEKIKNLHWQVKSTIVSYNNSDVKRSQMKFLSFENFEKEELHILWVGRYQNRKKLEDLIGLAKRNPKIKLKIVGPGIKENLSPIIKGSSIELFDAVYHDDLEKFFKWSDIVVNPGHVGLLAMNAGKNGRAIVVGKNDYQAPEIQLVKDANQWMIDFNDVVNVDLFFEELRLNKNLLRHKAKLIYKCIYEKYTVEYSVNQFIKTINALKQ